MMNEMTGEGAQYVEAVEKLLNERLTPLVEQVDDHDGRIVRIESRYITRAEVERIVSDAVSEGIRDSVGPAITDWFQSEWKPYGRLIKVITAMIPTLAAIFGILTALGWI